MSTDRLLEQAMALPPSARADLAARLIESLDETEDEDAATAWDVEIERRIAAYELGKAKAVAWEEAEPQIFGENEAAT